MFTTTNDFSLLRETLSFNPVFSPFCIEDGWIARAWLSTSPPYFAAKLYWIALTL